MKITWEVSDGYVGQSRTQDTEVPDDEIAECESQGELELLINDYIQEDFENTVTWEVLGDYPEYGG